MTFACMRLPEPYSQNICSDGGRWSTSTPPIADDVLGLEIWDGIREMHIYVLRTYICKQMHASSPDRHRCCFPHLPRAPPPVGSAGDWIRHGSGRNRRVRGHGFLQGFSPGFIKAPRVGHLPSILPTAWFFILERSRLRYTREGARLYCPSDPVLAAQYLLAVSRMQIAAALSWAPAPQCDVWLYAALVTLLIRQRPSSGAARESISNSLVCVCTRDT